MRRMTEALSSYVPRLLSHRLSAGPIRAPETHRTPATLLLTDIKDFTAFVEEFTDHGRAGLEELSRAVNAYFGQVVDLVYAHGGDVLSIAGDAFLCSWPAADPADLPEATLRAVQCGRAIQAEVGSLTVKGRPFATRIGIGAGELITAFVGGVNGRWEMVTAGSALRQVLPAEKQAPAGEVVLSLRAWSLVEDRCRSEALAGGLFRLQAIEKPIPPVETPPRPGLGGSDSLLEPFIAASVPEELLGPGIDWAAEVRPVTVMLTELPDPGDVDPESLERTHRAVRTLQEVVQRFEGAERLLVDDKGITVLAAFGLPPMAHENDAERAVHAAEVLRDALARHGMRRGVGLASGRAFCGVFGSSLRREYTLCGDCINLAARLLQAAHGDVLCDQATTQTVRHRIEFETLPPIVVKGREQTVPVFRPRGRGPLLARPESPMIGRLTERALLEDRLNALHTRREGGTVLIEGEAGIGKTRLIAELVALAGAHEVRVLTAAADIVERSTAYYAWRPVFAEVFGLQQRLGDADAARARVARRMADFPTLHRLTPLLSAVLAVQIPDNAFTAEMQGDTRADNTNHLLSTILSDIATREPVVLVIEDAHWLDSSSWALLLEVIRSVGPLLVVAALRPLADPIPSEVARVTERDATDILRLDGLSREDTVSLIAQRLGVRHVAAPLADFVYDRVAGHPFFCEELLQAMLEAGAIRATPDSCDVGDLTGLDLPATVEGAILARLDRLSPEQQLCLKVASVIGRVFQLRTVVETHPVESERRHVAEHLESLVGLDLTQVETPQPDLAYVFKHVITRDVTYDLMTHSQRQPLHRAVARWFELEHANDLSPHSALLAYHWAQAGDPSRTVTYLERAGRQALRTGAFREAVQFIERAIDLHENGEVTADRTRRALWEKALGEAHYFLGDLGTSRRHVERAVALLDRPIPAPRLAVTWALLRSVVEQLAHVAMPQRFLGRRAAEKAPLDEAVDCYKILGQIYYLDGESADRIVYMTLRGLNVGEAAGPSPALACVVVNTGTLLSLLGFTRWADHYTSRAIQMAEKEGQYAAAAYVWNIMALKEAQRGNWDAARAANERTMDVIHERADYNLEAEAWVVRATINICEGNFAAAAEAWPRERALAERNGNPQILCWSLLDETDTYLGRGDTDAAGLALEAALAIPTALADGSSTIDKHRALAMTRLRQGRHAEAVEAADVVVDMVRRQAPTGYHWVDFCASAVDVYLSVLETSSAFARDNRSGLEARARRGCKLLHGLSRNFWNVRPRVWILRGLLHWHHGRYRQAVNAWQKAERIAIKKAMPFERARALLELGRHGQGDARALSRARDIFQRLGASYYATLASDALANESAQGNGPPSLTRLS